MITPELRAEISALPHDIAIEAWNNHFKVCPFDLTWEGMNTIKTDRQEMITFAPFEVQGKLISYIQECWQENKMCWILFPKARRGGISTASEVTLTNLASQMPNTNALVVANKADSADNIFEITKICYDKLYSGFKPDIKHDNKKELSFEKIHSKILVTTADSKDIGRSFGFQLIHLSEFAFFSNPDLLMTSLMSTIPRNMFSLLIIESTGNGVGGLFYDLVKAAEAGENAYKLFFFAWWERDANTMPIPKGEKFILQSDGRYGNEAAIQKAYNIPMEKMYWRRWEIKNTYNYNLQTFRQENPSNLDECFQASGVNAFDVEKLNIIEKDTKPHRWQGILVEEDNKVVFREDVNGWLLIWEKPEYGWDNLYNLSLDTGGVWERTLKDCADWSVGIVRNRQKRADVAQFHIHAPAHIVAHRTVLLGRYYDNCKITPEINKWITETDDMGEPVINILRDNYTNLYYRKTYDTKIKEWKKQLGFHTNKQTKKLLIQKWTEVIDNYAELGENINDIEIVKELKMYITNDTKGTYEATEGEKDDRVLSYAINLLTSDEMSAPSIKQIDDIVPENYNGGFL